MAGHQPMAGQLGVGQVENYHIAEQIYFSRRPINPVKGGQGGGGGGGGDLLGSLLQGVQLNVLDAKFIGLGFVREDLVGELCTRATNQLLEEGESRAQEQVDLSADPPSSLPDLIVTLISTR